MLAMWLPFTFQTSLSRDFVWPQTVLNTTTSVINILPLQKDCYCFDYLGSMVNIVARIDEPSALSVPQMNLDITHIDIEILFEQGKS